MRSLLSLLGASLLLASGCAHQPAAPPAPTCQFASANDGTQSYNILCRDPVANRVKVKHILLSWRDLDHAGRAADPRAEARSYADTQALARQLLARLQAGEAIEPMMEQYSEDPGSAHSGMAYEASPGAALVSEFKSLSLRLQVHQAGIVKTSFGLHIIQREE